MARHKKALGLKVEAYLQESSMLSDWIPATFLRWAVGGSSRIGPVCPLGLLTATRERKELGSDVEEVGGGW